MKLETLKKEVWWANAHLPEENPITTTWGNVSGIDREEGLIVTRPDGIPHRELQLEHMVVVDQKGNTVEGRLRPFPDILTHCILYQHFPEIGSIAHTYSSFACVWAQAGFGIPCLGVIHAHCFRGTIPCTRALTTEEMKENYQHSVGKVIVERFHLLDYREIPGVLVAYHGPFTWGQYPREALYHSVVLEEVAKTTYFALLFNPKRKPVPPALLRQPLFPSYDLSVYSKERLSTSYKTLKLAGNKVEAELIRGHLENEGIGVILKPSTFPYGGEAYFGDTGPFEIQVPEERLLDAQRIIADLEK
ncbi:MAG: class II aldolase/adducin family protein [Atribacterota bacterium]